MSTAKSLPRITVSNHQRSVKIEVARLRGMAELAVPLCEKRPGGGGANLGALAEVEVVLVSDRLIAQIHRRFMNISGATDVITFEHGEIVVSATTAAREGEECGEPVDREVLRYTVHGLLHLNGHEDVQPQEAAAMWKAQEEIVARLWPG